MVYEIEADILETEKADIICHQVNCHGMMGAGIAKQIREKYPDVFRKYRNVCRKEGVGLLGRAQVIACQDGKYVANLFGQDGYGRDRQYTDYAALDRALFEVRRFAVTAGKTVGMPYGIGCGLAGGDWEFVRGKIEKIFGGPSADCYICRLPENAKKESDSIW